MNCLDFNIAKEDYLQPVLNRVTEEQFYWAEGCIFYILDNEVDILDAMDFFKLKDPVIPILVNFYKRLCLLNSWRRLPMMIDLKLFEEFWGLERSRLDVKPKLNGHSSLITTLLLEANKGRPLSHFFDNSREWSSAYEADLYLFILANTGNDITCEEGARRWIQKCRGESLGCH